MSVARNDSKVTSIKIYISYIYKDYTDTEIGIRMNVCEFITKWLGNWVSFQHVMLFPHVQVGDSLQVWD
jgi:hypothetical protein